MLKKKNSSVPICLAILLLDIIFASEMAMGFDQPELCVVESSKQFFICTNKRCNKACRKQGYPAGWCEGPGIREKCYCCRVQPTLTSPLPS